MTTPKSRERLAEIIEKNARKRERLREVSAFMETLSPVNASTSAALYWLSWLGEECMLAWAFNEEYATELARYREALEEILSIQPSQKDLDDAGHGLKLEQIAEYRIAHKALSQNEGGT